MFERYTERARRVIFFARYEASQFGGTSIETEHLLLGILREDQDVIRRFLPAVSPESIRNAITQHAAGSEKLSTSIDMPVSNACKRVFAYAAEEVAHLHQRHVDSGHLVLGMLREENGLVAQILSGHGLNLAAAREIMAHAVIPEEQPHAAHDLKPAPQASGGIATAAGSETVTPIAAAAVVPDAETAIRIAEAVWQPSFGQETISRQRPLQAELKFNVWIVAGSSAREKLFAFILQSDGRILSFGCEPSKPGLTQG